MAKGEDALEVLRSMDTTLKALLAFARQHADMERASRPKPVASDADLDGTFGDPVLKFKPRDWIGTDFKNARFSQCPPDLLDLVADSYDYFARKADESDERTAKGKPVSYFKRADAARARGWAKRMRDGTHVAPPDAIAHVDAETEGWSSAEAEPPPEPGWADAPVEDDIPW